MLHLTVHVYPFLIPSPAKICKTVPLHHEGRSVHVGFFHAKFGVRSFVDGDHD